MRTLSLVVASCLFASSVLSADAQAEHLKKLADVDEKVREAAAKELDKINYVPGGEGLDIVLKGLNDTNATVQKYCMTAIAQLHQPVEAAMKKLSPERREALREAYMEGLKRRSEKDPELKRELDGAKFRRNHIIAITGCKAYAEAQEIYRRTDHNKDQVLEYAQSLQGNHSLFELAAGKGDLKLITKEMAEAAYEELGKDKAKPTGGYFVKILKKQGKNATGGARDYIRDGRMTLGYGLLAFPAKYDETGRYCFVINNNGTIFQKDLGKDTEKIATEMKEFDPDNTWEAVDF